MSPPEVSVIIPTYNRAHLIARAIDCVLRQTHAHCHVIVVDDGSTDATPRVIAERYGNEPRVRYLRQKNAGVSAARNAALAAARGDYIAFLDSDDVWRPWKLALQVACLERLRGEGVGILWSDKDIVDDAGALMRAAANRTAYGVYRLFRVEEMFSSASSLRALVPDHADPKGDTRVYWGDVYPFIAMGNLCAPSSVILTRERAQKVGDFDVTMRSGEDHKYHLAACSFGPAAFLDLATIDYRKGAADQLTAHGYELMIAQNALATVVGALDDPRVRDRLPPAVIRDKLASLHAWIGIKLMESQDQRAARAHLARSLRQRPGQPRVWALLAAASLPARVTGLVRASYRAARSAASRVRTSRSGSL